MSTSAADRRAPLGLFPGQLAPRPYDGVAEVLRTRYYSRRTGEAYLHGTRRFLLEHKDVQSTMVYTRIESWRSRSPEAARLSAQKPSTESGGIIRTEWSA